MISLSAFNYSFGESNMTLLAQEAKVHSNRMPVHNSNMLVFNPTNVMKF